MLLQNISSANNALSVFNALPHAPTKIKDTILIDAAASCRVVDIWLHVSERHMPALGCEGIFGGLGLAEDVHMVVGHALLRYEDLLAAIDDKVSSLHAYDQPPIRKHLVEIKAAVCYRYMHKIQ